MTTDESKLMGIWFAVGALILVVGLIRAGYKRTDRGDCNDSIADGFGSIALALAWPFALGLCLLAVAVLGPLWLLFQIGVWKRRWERKS